MYAAAAFAPDGKILAVARGGEIDGNNGKVTLIDAGTGKKIRELTPGHLNGATDVVFHPEFLPGSAECRKGRTRKCKKGAPRHSSSAPSTSRCSVCASAS